jgi:hypothetical protein
MFLCSTNLGQCQLLGLTSPFPCNTVFSCIGLLLREPYAYRYKVTVAAPTRLFRLNSNVNEHALQANSPMRISRPSYDGSCSHEIHHPGEVNKRHDKPQSMVAEFPQALTGGSAGGNSAIHCGPGENPPSTLSQSRASYTRPQQLTVAQDIASGIPFRVETTYTCLESSCNRKYSRKPDLVRHYKGAHLRDDTYKCRVPTCERSERGFPRRDKRNDHERKIHRLRM